MKMSLQRYGRLLVRYLWPHWPRVLLLTVLILGNVGIQLFKPQVLRSFIDGVQSQQTVQSLIFIALIYFLTAGVGYLFTIGETYYSADIGWNATNALRADLSLHLLKLDLSFHNARTPGELIERVDGDISPLFDVLSSQFIRVISYILLFSGVLLSLYFVHWVLGVGLTLYSILVLFLLNRLRNFATKQMEAFHQAKAELSSFLEERVSGAEDLRSNGAISYTIQQLYRQMRTVWQKELSGGIRMTIMQNITIVVFAIGTTFALFVGAYLFLTKLITLGTIFLIFQYTQLLIQPLQGMTQEVHNLQDAMACLKRIDDLLDTESGIQDHGSQSLPASALEVEVEDVRFGYHEDSIVLHNLSFHLQPGRVLGLLGRTGSGKTTITRLLFRLYEAKQGHIRLNGISLPQIEQSQLRQRIALVTQDVQIFQASLRNNLTFFDLQIPDEEVIHTLEEVGLKTWFTSLPAGLDTGLSADKIGLSAGEMQLLALARAFLKKPGLVILDEATSRLDPVTERLIEQAITRLFEGRTGIIIAHRLETVQRVDDILILEDGNIREQGEREHLMSDPQSVFTHLLKTGLREVLA